MNIASILRHWFTLAATLITGWLLATLTLSPEQQAELAKAFSDLMGPLVIIITLIITAAWRIALGYLGKVFAGKKTVSSGGSLLVIGGAVAGLLCTALPSCSPEQQALLKEYPIKACYIKDGVRVCASSKSGLGIEVDQTSRK